MNIEQTSTTAPATPTTPRPAIKDEARALKRQLEKENDTTTTHSNPCSPSKRARTAPLSPTTTLATRGTPEIEQRFVLMIQYDGFSECFSIPHNSACVFPLKMVLEQARMVQYVTNGYKHTESLVAVADAFTRRVCEENRVRSDYFPEFLFKLDDRRRQTSTQYDIRDIISTADCDRWTYHANDDGLLTLYHDADDKWQIKEMMVLNYYG